ncbi:MAG: tRNA guanosine(34) transglycosylase Tgt [Phycisphaerae bacterium]
MPPDFAFRIVAHSGNARRGVLHTPHGTVDTPAFMPVGTRATIKGLTPVQVARTGTQIVLANAYHLILRPRPELIAQLGGVHRFMGWNAPVLTDSGGFQVFSLSDLRRVSDDGVVFRSHVDGELITLTPELSIAAQNQIGADIIMAFDECPALPADAAKLDAAVARTVAWARRSKAAHGRSDQALYGIVQGGLDVTRRRACLERLLEIGFDGYALGGLSVGEPPPEMWAFLADFTPLMPADRPRYLMGVGTPLDLVSAVAAGIDQFDCVLPTRNGRKGYAFTSEGVLRMRNARHRDADAPLDRACGCYACTNFSRAYLRHLFMHEEVLGGVLVSIHNLAFYQSLMRQMRAAIEQHALESWRRAFFSSPAARTSEDKE